MNKFNLYEFRYEERELVKGWFEKNGHLLEDLVVEEPMTYSFKEEYHSVPRGASKKPGPRKEEMDDYELRSDEYEKAGYVKYVCARCGEEYDYEPSTCYVKEDDGFPCWCDQFDIVHGPFEGVYMDNKAAIQCGDFQGLARNSAFEDGADFNSVICTTKDGLFVGYMTEEEAVNHEVVEQRWAYFDLDKVEKRVAIRKEVLETVKRVMRYFQKKAAKKVLSYAICYYHGHEYGPYSNGYIYPSVRMILKDGTGAKMNYLAYRRFDHRIYEAWAEANNVKVRNSKEINEYEAAYNKLVKKLSEMPNSPRDKADLINNGWFKMDKIDLENAMKHSGYLFRRNGRAPINGLVFKALQGYQQRIGA